MKIQKLIYALLLCIASFQTTQGQHSLRVLNFQADNGFQHDSKKVALDMIETLGVENNWEVVTSSEPADITPQKLQTFDVIVFNNNCGNDGRIFSDAQQMALQHYIRSGGGFVGIHCAGTIWQEEGVFQSWYEKLVGTRMVAHLRTPKDEDVTIPNANILIGNITNYTKSKNRSIFLYTTITLGYDLPWQTAEKLLLDAASKVELVLKDPKPFVLQTSLDAYYVSYELNIACNEPKKMPLIYSEVHKSILEVFNDAGVEILSPAYTATRDGNLTTVPSQIKDNEKSPIVRLVDHLTGRNQKITITGKEDVGKV